MTTTEEKALFVIFFCLGVIVDFSELAEQTWLATYSIRNIEWITAAINFPWGPIRMYFGRVSDRLSIKCHPAVQLGVVMTLPFIAWAGIILTVRLGVQPYFTVLLLILAEFGPAIVLTIVESIMVKYIRSMNVQLSPMCRRYQLLGKALGGYSGSLLLHWTSEYQVFVCQWGIITFAALLYIPYVMPHLHHDPPVVDANDPEENETTKATVQQDGDRYYVLFMILISMMPIGKNAYFYYLFGPLGLTANEFGLGKLVASTIAFGCTFSLPYIERWLTQRQLMISVAWMFSLVSLLKVLQVVRYLEVGDFYVYVLVTALGTLADSLVWTHYVAVCTRWTQASEGFAWYMTAPTIGKMGRILSDYALLYGFNINHDEYGQLPTVMMICYWASLIPFYYTLVGSRT